MLEFEIHKLVESAKTDQNLANDDQPIVLYCGTGGRSALAAQCLESIGYKNVSSMSGGIVAWAAAHLPLDFPA
jgi:rhodanese-related sulfurtransferase